MMNITQKIFIKNNLEKLILEGNFNNINEINEIKKFITELNIISTKNDNSEEKQPKDPIKDCVDYLDKINVHDFPSERNIVSKKHDYYSVKVSKKLINTLHEYVKTEGLIFSKNIIRLKDIDICYFDNIEYNIVFRTYNINLIKISDDDKFEVENKEIIFSSKPLSVDEPNISYAEIGNYTGLKLLVNNEVVVVNDITKDKFVFSDNTTRLLSDMLRISNIKNVLSTIELEEIIVNSCKSTFEIEYSYILEKQLEPFLNQEKENVYLSDNVYFLRKNNINKSYKFAGSFIFLNKLLNTDYEVENLILTKKSKKLFG